MRLRFRDCTFETQTRELRRLGQAVDISPKAFELLALLLAERPRPVSHARLRDALWPDTHVTHTSLPRLVHEARRAIGDSARTGALIRTVSRFGYAFAAGVVEEAGRTIPSHGCALVGEDRDFVVPEGRTLVGRGPECGVWIVSPQVSRVHAHVDVVEGRATVVDNRSKNGTWVNGRRIDEPTMLRDGDELVFGNVRVVYRDAASQITTRTGRPR